MTFFKIVKVCVAVKMVFTSEVILNRSHLTDLDNMRRTSKRLMINNMIDYDTLVNKQLNFIEDICKRGGTGVVSPCAHIHMAMVTDFP